MQPFQIDIAVDPRFANKLGGMGLTDIQAFCEFINNSIANKFKSSVKVVIEIAISKNNPSSSYIKVSDDASGIPGNRLKECLSVCGTANSSRNPLSEHGIGLKAGAQTLGQLSQLKTKIAVDSYANVVCFPKGYECKGTYEVKPEVCSFEHGTEITIKEIKGSGTVRRKEWITGTLIKHLGQRYRYRFKSDLKIEIRYVDLDDSLGVAEMTLPVTYDAPDVKFTKEQVFNGVKVKIGLAYTRTERVNKKLPHDPSNPLMHSGATIECIKDNVVVCVSEDISRFSAIRSNNMYLPVRIEIYCDDFTTVLAKTNLEESDAFKELVKAINEDIKNDKRFVHDKKVSKRTETAKRNELVKRLRKHHPASNFDCEAYCANMNGEVDILETTCVDGKDCKFAWECKVDEATGADVVQLIGYMMLGDGYEPKGNLVAKKLGHGAKSAIVKFKKLGYEITFHKWSEFI